MAADVVWLDEAVDELDALLEFLFPHNPRAALDYVINLEANAKSLPRFL